MGKQSKNVPAASNKKATTPQGKEETTTTVPTIKGPPFDISQSEYQDLLAQIQDLTKEELEEELILAARYGDKDVVWAILDQKTPHQANDNDNNNNNIVSCQDAQNGNTPLHMAAANGHAEIVDKLLQCKSQHMTNQSGNTPLHWAAANGHANVVKLLLKRVPDIDVLAKNQFGRSSLTEGFSSQNTEVVKHLLEHDTASEEKLLQGTQQEEVDDADVDDDVENATKTDKKSESAKHNNDRSSPGEEGILHEFNFLLQDSSSNNYNNNNTNTAEEGGLKIRELPIPATRDPFGASPEKDTTGYGIWAASLVMARWMAASSDRFQGKALLELGAGCGVPGLSAAFYSDASKVYVTDLNPKTVNNLRYNIDLNQQQSCPSGTLWKDRLQAMPINWEDPKTWPDEKIDFVIGSDLIYQSSIAPILKQVVLGLCRGQGSFLYVAPDIESEIGRDGLAAFIEEMKNTQGVQVVSEALAPQEYHANPLCSQDDDECFLHFHELSSASYRLYEFKMNVPVE